MITSPRLNIAFANDASFNVSIGGVTWLRSDPTRFFANGAWQPLKRTGVQHSAGSDSLGTYSCVNVSWSWNDDEQPLHTALKVYDDGVTAVFVQQLPRGANNTNASNPMLPSGLRVIEPGDYPPVLSFPSFSGGELESLSYLIWQSRMINAEYGRNVTGGPHCTNEPLSEAHPAGSGLQGLSTSGPLVLYNEAFHALVVAPMDNFKSALHYARRPHAIIDAGVTSELTSLPAGFEHRTMLTAGQGVTTTLDAWGRRFRKALGTDRSMAERDLNVHYLSYWTDNGAYYSGGNWGEAGGGGKAVNESAFRAVAAGLKEQSLDAAVRIWQLDDWWYHKATGGVYSSCVFNWSLPSTTFPSGLRGLSSALRTPWLLYVPFWCPRNVYEQSFRWIHSYNPQHPELIFAQPHPDDSARFYSMLFDYGVGNGMRGFEHDYLDYNFLSMPHLRRTFGAANAWLEGIDHAARQRGLPVQMCMALPSDLMASVRFASVTNYRASTDYGIADKSLPLQPRDDNINIGASSLLGFALGLRPSKDSLWTARPPNCRGVTAAERANCGGKGAQSNPGSNIELNAIVATLSTGPVALADKARATNVTIVRRCVRRDGRILQPDKPATAVDSTFAQRTWTLGSRRAPPGMVWAASTVLSGATWHYVLSIDVDTPWRMHSSDFFPPLTPLPPLQQRDDQALGAASASAVAVAQPAVAQGWVALSWFTSHRPTACAHGSHAVASGCVAAHVCAASDVPPLHNIRPIMEQNDTHRFDLLTLAPLVHGWAFLGEAGAYVRASRERFESVRFSPSGIRVALLGSDGETVEVTALRPMQMRANGDAVGQAEWTVLVKRVTFRGGSRKAEVAFA